MKQTLLVLAALVVVSLVAHAQRNDRLDGPPPATRFVVFHAETIADGRLSVIRDRLLPNAPCFYLFQSAYGAQMMPTPGGVCQ